MNKFCLQLSAVKDALEVDFKGTLNAVSDFGYDGVEFYGYYGDMSADELLKYLDYIGLTAVSAQLDMDELENNLEYHAEYLSALGCSHIVCGGAEFNTADEAEAMGSRLEMIALNCIKLGLNFSYLADSKNFEKAENGEYLFDIMMQDRTLVLTEPDMYQMSLAGVNIDDMLRKYAGRASLLHINQINNGAPSLLEKGEIDFAPLLKTAKLVGVEHYIVGQDMPTDSELDDAQSNIDFIKSVSL